MFTHCRGESISQEIWPYFLGNMVPRGVKFLRKYGQGAGGQIFLDTGTAEARERYIKQSIDDLANIKHNHQHKIYHRS